MSIESTLSAGLSAMHLALPPEATWQLSAYLRLIEKWNRVHNLTAVREPEKMVVLHLLDSLSVLPHVANAKSLLDVGTGAGLPGIPLAIARPDLDVTLLDSSHKKAAFLEQAKAELGLANVTVVCERVEQWRPGRTFDAVVSRAFSELAEFVAQSAHLVSPGGNLLAMKGVHPFDEIERLPASHCVETVIELEVPTLDAKRHLVLLRAA
jgi:16S rRNA (guanine527-N7)-methyltransferase